MAKDKKHEQEAPTATTMTAPDTGTKAMVAYEYGDDSGKGFEHQSKRDTSIPFINLLQALSPIVAAEKAKPGQFRNTVTEQLWDRDQGFLWVPGTTRNVYVEWTPRDTPGGGYRGQHAIESEIVMKAIKIAASKPEQKFGKYFTEDGNILQETFYVYGAICSEEGEALSMALMAFDKTKIKPYRAWMTRLRQMTVPTPDGRRVRPPLYAHLTRVTSVQTQNAEKKMYYVPVLGPGDPRGLIQSLLPLDDERLQMAKMCAQLADSGEAKVDFARAQESGETEDDAAGHPFGD